jgi:hypothetical protein
MYKLASSTINNALPNTHEHDRTINDGFQHRHDDYWPCTKTKFPPSSESRALRNWLVSEERWGLLEPSHSKIWSWVLWDIKPRATVLARASSNLTDRPKLPPTCIYRSISVTSVENSAGSLIICTIHFPSLLLYSSSFLPGPTFNSTSHV